jgi:hypothetical protein
MRSSSCTGRDRVMKLCLRQPDRAALALFSIRAGAAEVMNADEKYFGQCAHIIERFSLTADLIFMPR